MTVPATGGTSDPGEVALFRWGGILGIVSAVVGVVFNAVHPRASSRSLEDTTEHLRIVSGSGSWRVVHLVSAVAVLVGVVAIAIILWSMVRHGSRRWPYLALALVIITTPLLLVSVGLDGFAIKSVADRWADASGGQRQALLTAATSLRSVDVAALDLVMISQFGLTALVLGVATWTSPLYGRGLAVVALAGGGTGLLCGVIQGVSGRLTTFSYLVLLTVSLGLFTLWAWLRRSCSCAGPTRSGWRQAGLRWLPREGPDPLRVPERLVRGRASGRRTDGAQRPRVVRGMVAGDPPCPPARDRPLRGRGAVLPPIRAPLRERAGPGASPPRRGRSPSVR